jgi:hypothetical protein
MQGLFTEIRTALTDATLMPRASEKLKNFCKEADYRTCRDLVALFKSAIISPSGDVWSKVNALELLNSCVESNNSRVLSALGDKFIERLAILASHNLSSDDPEKGRNLFGKLSSASAVSQRASVLFLDKLHECFLIWAQAASKASDDGAAKISVQFSELLRKGLKVSKLKLPQALQDGLNRYYRAITRLEAALSLDNPAKLEKCASKAMSLKTQLETQISELSESEAYNATHISVLIEANDALAEVIQKFEQSKEASDSELSIDLEEDVLEGVHAAPSDLRLKKKPHKPLNGEAKVRAFRGPEPILKRKPHNIPRSPRSLEKSSSLMKDLLQEQSIIESNLQSSFNRLFEIGNGAIEERYSQLVSTTQQEKCEELHATLQVHIRTIEGLNQAMSATYSELETHRSENAELRQNYLKVKDLRRAIETAHFDLETQMIDNASLRQQLEDNEAKISELAETKEAFSKQSSSLEEYKALLDIQKSENATLKQQLRVFEATQSELAETKEALSKQSCSLEEYRLKMKALLSKQSSSLEEYRLETKALQEAQKSENATLKQQLQAYEATQLELDAAKKTNAEQSGALEKYKLKIKAVKKQLEACKKELEELSETKSRALDATPLEHSPSISYPMKGPTQEYTQSIGDLRQRLSLGGTSTENKAESLSDSCPSPTSSEVQPSRRLDFFQFEVMLADPTPMLTALIFDNLEGYSLGCCYDTAIIYEDISVQVGFKFTPADACSGVVWLYLDNKAETPLMNVDCQLMGPQGLTVLLEHEGKREQLLYPRQKQNFKISYKVTQIFKSSPSFHISFTHNSAPVLLKLKLPLVISRFLQPCNLLSTENFDLKWGSYADERQAYIALRPSIKTLDELVWIMRLSSHFKVISDSASIVNCKVISAAYLGNSVVMVCLDLEQSSLKVKGTPRELVEASFALIREVLEA